MTWITGKEILDRPGWGLTVDLIRAYKEWGLSPFRQIDGARMIRGSKCCFNCTKASLNYTPGLLDEQGNCIPIKLSDLPEELTVPCSPLELAMEIDPALVEHFFEDGAFVFHSGVFSLGVTPSVARLLTGVFGPNVVERLMLEGLCADFDPMGYLDMGDRLLAARFRLLDVKRYEFQHGIVPVAQADAPAPVQLGQKPDGKEFALEAEDPKDFAEQLLAQGKDPGQVMLALVERYAPSMQRWKAAGLALRRPIVGLDPFEKDNLKSRYYDRTRKYAQS